MTHDVCYSALQGIFKALDITHFHPEELIPGRREVPPIPLWGNIIPTVRVLNDIRVATDSPIHINSAWRPAWYNKQIGGAAKSQHVEFSAIDFTIRNVSPDEAAELLGEHDSASLLGIGMYNTFTHVDSRHWPGRPGHGKPPARWDNRR